MPSQTLWPLAEIEMTHFKLLGFITFLLLFCNCTQSTNDKQKDSQTSHRQMTDVALSTPLQVGDKVELSGGYDYDPMFLKNPPATKRVGTVIQFIKGQNETLAAVVRLNEKITGKKITGDIAVLELRYEGQTWKDPSPVHIELCDFLPTEANWKDRKQGEWIEAAATVKVIR